MVGGMTSSLPSPLTVNLPHPKIKISSLIRNVWQELHNKDKFQRTSHQDPE